MGEMDLNVGWVGYPAGSRALREVNRLRAENKLLRGKLDRFRRLHGTTADHLRKVRKRNRVLADLNEALSDDVARWWGNEDPDGAANAPRHYQGDGRVTCRRALWSCLHQGEAVEDICPMPLVWWGLAFRYVWRLWWKEDPRRDALKAIDCLGKLVEEFDMEDGKERR